MGMLPDIKDGKLVLHDESDDQKLLPVLNMLPTSKRIQAERLISNEKYSVRHALEAIGVMVCER